MSGGTEGVTRWSIRRRRLATGVLLVVPGLLAGACSQAAAPPDGPEQQSDTGAAVSRIAIAIGAEPGSMDPLLSDDGQRDAFHWNVYEGLTQRVGQDMVVEPSLAERWEADGTTWTFHLRAGVTFHDGEPLTAADVAASYERALNPDLGSEISSRLGTISEVRAVDDLTVEIETQEPDPIVPVRATYVVIAPAAWAAPDNQQMAEAMMGTGPYRFVDWERGQAITLERYEGYWGDEPAIDEANVQFLAEDASRLAALQTGEIQLARNLPPELATQAPVVASGPVSEVSMLRINSTSGGPFSDAAVREAAVLAIDRQAIIEGLYGGFASSANGQITGPFVFGFNPALEEYPFDPDRARELLTEAGAEGAAITLAAPVGRFLKDREVNEAMVGMLEDVGFTVEAEFLDVSQWLERLAVATEDPSRAPDLTFIGHGNELFDPDQSLATYILCDGRFSLYCNEEVDALARQARTNLDEDEREGQYRQVWALLRDDFAYVPVALMQQVHGVVEDVVWEPRPDALILLREITLP